MAVQQNTQAVSLVETSSSPGGVELVNSRRTTKLSCPEDLVELAQTIQKADEFVKSVAGSKLTVIADQVKYLQEQARKVLVEAKRDNTLHHAACNLVKKPGQMYYLYERESGQKYMSILSPQEWGASCPHEFIGAYRLEYDMSWTSIEDVDARSEQFAMIDKILNTQKSICDTPTLNILGSDS